MIIVFLIEIYKVSNVLKIDSSNNSNQISSDCIVGEALANKFNAANVVKTANGQFPGLVTGYTTWLISVQRYSTALCCVLLCQNYSNSIQVCEIKKDAGFTYTTNSNGSVDIKYNNSNTGVYGGALALFYN